MGSAFFLPETGQHPALEGRLQAATLLCKGFVVAEVQRNVGQQIAERFQQCLQIALVALQLLQCGAAVADSGLKLGNDLAAVLAGCLKLAQYLLLLGAELLQMLLLVEMAGFEVTQRPGLRINRRDLRAAGLVEALEVGHQP